MSKATEAFSLQRPARAQWLAEFCAERLATPSRAPRFPSLGKEETPSGWIVRQYQDVNEDMLQANVRESVGDLIQARGGKAADRNQVLGAMLQVADALDFHENKSVLAGWVRRGWVNKDHHYKIGVLRMPIRRIVWALLIKWNHLDVLVPQLAGYLLTLAKTNETGTAQLCFVELGQRDPAMALDLIPDITTRWHRTYWSEAIEKLIGRVGPRTLLSNSYAHAWSRCIGPCFYSREVFKKIRDAAPLDDADRARPIWLKDVLNRAGIIVHCWSREATLSSTAGGFLTVDVSEYSNIDEYGGATQPRNMTFRQFQQMQMQRAY